MILGVHCSIDKLINEFKYSLIITWHPVIDSSSSNHRMAKIMHKNSSNAISKVPELTLIFWVIKILATTLGETGGDAVSMSMNLGYLVSTVIFSVLFFVAVSAQVSAKSYNPTLYWATIIATTTVGTTLADFADRSLGIGYAGGSTILFLLLLGSFWVWHRAQGEISSSVISSPRTEMFYWITIMFSQTLGTALGDWTADNAGFGYAGSTVVFGAILLAIVAAYIWSKASRTLLFWAAFIITSPLGAVVGDFLDKPISKGGLEMSRYSASVALLVAIVALVYIATWKSKQDGLVALDLDADN